MITLNWSYFRSQDKFVIIVMALALLASNRTS